MKVVSPVFTVLASPTESAVVTVLTPTTLVPSI